MLDLTRKPGWPDRLLAAVASHRAQPFAWGQHDCATLFGAAVEAVTGFHIMAAYLPYDSERGAMKQLAGSGYRDMEHFARCMFPTVAPAQARRGDLGMTKDLVRLSCPAVILGAEAVSRDQSGWIVFPAKLLTVAFRVG